MIEVTAASVEAGFNKVLIEVFNVPNDESKAKPLVVPMFAVTVPVIAGIDVIIALVESVLDANAHVRPVLHAPDCVAAKTVFVIDPIAFDPAGSAPVMPNDEFEIEPITFAPVDKPTFHVPDWVTELVPLKLNDPPKTLTSIVPDEICAKEVCVKNKNARMNLIM